MKKLTSLVAISSVMVGLVLMTGCTGGAGSVPSRTVAHEDTYVQGVDDESDDVRGHSVEVTLDVGSDESDRSDTDGAADAGGRVDEDRDAGRSGAKDASGSVDKGRDTGRVGEADADRASAGRSSGNDAEPSGANGTQDGAGKDAKPSQSGDALNSAPVKDPMAGMFHNNASYFHYYDQLPAEGKAVYDAAYDVALHPTTGGYVRTVQVDVKPGTPEAVTLVQSATCAIEKDHPELFYLRKHPIEYRFNQNVGGMETSVSLQLTSTYDNCKQEMTEFNNAVDSFREDCQLLGSDPFVILDIHDKLIDLVSYDEDYEDAPADDYTYTAYGAFVANSRGERNTCVCAGYAMALHYLLQQSGEKSIYVVGYAGGPDGQRGQHAWNEVKIRDSWYVIDATWDDALDPETTDMTDRHNRVAASDARFADRLRHRYFLLTTEEFEDFQPGDAYTYHFDDGTSVSFDSGSSHVVDEKDERTYGYVVPDALGTKYDYEELARELGR